MRRNVALAVKAKRYGARYALRIVLEARRVGIPVSLGFALVEQESGFRNVFGHDPTIYVGAGTVTKAKYLGYRRLRGRSKMQGVGPCQLTWWAYQDEADRRGGCWVPKHNIAVGFEILADHIQRYGRFSGIARYNGSGAHATLYARRVLDRAERWHDRLT
jgi:soluble lytic murein transglycosylase-like protein